MSLLIFRGEAVATFPRSNRLDCGTCDIKLCSTLRKKSIVVTLAVGKPHYSSRRVHFEPELRLVAAGADGEVGFGTKALPR